MPKSDLAENTIDQLSIAVARVGSDHKILGFNRRFCEWFSSNIPEESLLKSDFYEAMGSPFFLEGVYAPFYYAKKDRKPTKTIVGEVNSAFHSNGYISIPKLSACKRIFVLLVSPNFSGNDNCTYIVEIVDFSESTRMESRLDMLKSAGSELTEVTDQYQVFNEEEQKERLREKIKNHMLHTLKYDVFEIRTLEPGPRKRLVPFMSFGLNPDAAQRDLFAESNNNGITGYVADSGEPYICDDAQNDAHYLQGAINARSSLTVPLLFGNKVIGVCNVESSEPHAFSKNDETFLQLYAKDLAFAIHLHSSISQKIREVRFNCTSLLYQEIAPISSEIFDLSLSLCNNLVSTTPSNTIVTSSAHKLLEDTSQLTCKLSELKTKYVQTEFSYKDYPKTWHYWLAYYKSAVKFLLHKRILLVCNDDPTVIVDQLERFACQVDVVHSTSNALTALREFRYDIILTEKNPDGLYFNFNPDKKESSINPYNRSVYDIHEDNYFVPVEGNEEDARERQRIHDEVYIQHKLDAYFFKQTLDKLNLGYDPLYIICVFKYEYDPTHIANGLTIYNGWKQPMFTVSRDTPKALLNSVNDCLIERNNNSDIYQR